MAVGFLVFVIWIILSGVSTLLCVVFSILYFANGKKGKFAWLAGFLISLVSLIAAIFLTVNTAVNKVKEATHNMAEKWARNLDTTANDGYNLADSINSQQIKYLKLLEPMDASGSVPGQFYNYLGFRDYYRMPLRYPFSIHCIESVQKGCLFNEKGVERFDQSDNGEVACDVDDINAFVFDKDLFIGKKIDNTRGKQHDTYVIYHFLSGEKESIDNIEKLANRTKTLGFSRPLKFVSCQDYFDLF